MPISHIIQAQTLPWPRGGLPECGESTSLGDHQAGNWGTSPSSFPGTAIRFRHPVEDRAESFHPIHGARDQTGRALADAVPVAPVSWSARPIHSGRVRADRTGGSPSHSVLCPILRHPRVRAFHRRTCSSASLDQCLFYRTISREIFFRNMEIVGVIPARFASTRLPGKALLSETGRPLILHVDRGGATGAIVTTDHRRHRRRADRRRP